MLEKFKTILNRMQESNKPVWVAALLKMDDLLDKWSVVISAPWVTEDNREEEFQTILNHFKENMDKEDLVSIARFGLFQKDAHLVEELLKRRAGTIIQDEKINGNLVHYGIIVESNPELEWQDSALFNSNNS